LPTIKTPISAADLLNDHEAQVDLDQWLHYYHTDPTHQSKMSCGRLPPETFIEGKEVWKEKSVDQIWSDRYRQQNGSLSDQV
tara:strand:- start:53213 stop:53458 length:246 start_codon:yes stop_codon:yes gene_type:complete